MEANGSDLGNKTLNALTFKLSVTQILTQVANDEFFFQFDDAIIPNMLHEMFVVNDSIHEEKFDTEEETAANVAEFLKSGTDLDKQEKALAISKKIVETTDLAQTEREEILAKLDELVKRFKEEQTEAAASASEAPVRSTRGAVSDDMLTVSPIRFARKSRAPAPEAAPAAAPNDYSAATTLDFQVRQSTSMFGLRSPKPSWNSPWEPDAEALSDGEAEDGDERIIALLSSSMPTLSSTAMTDTTVSDALLRTTSSDGGAAKTKKKNSQKRKTLRKKKEAVALNFSPNKKEPKYNWVQELRVESKTQEKTTRPRKFTKKKTLSQLVKKKMLGINFVNCASESAEVQKLQDEKREKDYQKLQTWLKSKEPKKQKKRPKFDLRSYAAKVSDIHAPKVGGMRNPYDLKGVQFVPAERLGAWQKSNSSGKKKWSSAFHTTEFPAPPDRAQKCKLKNQATARRAIQPKLITFGEYGEVEWFTCLKSQDAHYQMHAENMKRIQVARKMFEQKQNYK